MPGFEVVGGIVTNPAKEGQDLGELSGIEPIGVSVTTEVDEVLGDGRVDLIFYCGLGEPAEVAERLGGIAEAGKDAITVTGLVHPVAALGHDGAKRLDDRARAGGGRIVGAGWNPGFLLDVLPVVWGASCVRIDHVFAQRIAEMKDWGPGVHDECGIGFAPEDVSDTNSNPLHESVALIGDGLGLHLEAIENHHEPYLSSTRREHRGRVVEAGTNAGFHKRSIGLSADGRPLVEVEMYAIFCIDPTVDPVEEGASVRIEGDATIETSSGGDWFGDSYPVTAAKAIRSVRPLRTLRPGLYRPDQLPLSG